ncbi:MAG: AAA family ATPase [Kiloniellales bacterium]|nr:AAA family ATPase [Kiloniellales bacterium]
MTATALMEIKEAEIRKHYPQTYQLLAGFDYAPRIGRAAEVPAAGSGRSPGIPGRRGFRSTTPGLASRGAPSGVVSLLNRVQGIDAEDPLQSETQVHVLRSLRRALAVAEAVSELYGELTPLNQLKQANSQGRLAGAQKAEFAELLSSAALIGLFTFANLLGFLVRNGGETQGPEIEVGEVEEIVLDNVNVALKGALWELDQKLARFAEGDAALAAVVTAYAERLMDEAALRSGGARHLEAFVARTYRVEADDFQIDGFTPARRAASTPLVMTFKKPQEVIGNHIAKHQCMKLAKMLMAYDFTRQLNPFVELGGFIFTFMGDGKPGTGKTTLIQMLGGLLHDYCQVAGYAFRYENLSSESIDSYQGKSGQNAKAFIRSIMDPHVIGFGTIDDIDQIAGRRGDRQSSSGQQEVTAVLMESFSGANTVVRGNCSFGMFSNYPENVDDALRQRAGARFLVDGPRSEADYIDILHLLLGRDHDIALGAHELYAAQEIRRAVAASYEQHGRPAETQLEAVFEAVAKAEGPLDTIAKLGRYLKAIQEVDERFTGRAVKNITDAVKVRAMDVELPDEWMADPALFLRQDYDTKLKMIGELMNPITPEMVLQEINRYADAEFRYANVSDEAAVGDRVRDLRLQAEAKRRYLADPGGGGGEAQG